MQFRTWHLFTAVALVAVLIAIVIPWVRAYSGPTNCNYIVAASGNAGVNGYTFVDGENEVRVIVLEKLTTDSEDCKRTRNYNPNWLKFSMTREGRLHINIDGNDVRFDNQILVYYGIDGGSPKKLAVPANAVVPYEFPYVMWSRLIPQTADEQ